MSEEPGVRPEEVWAKGKYRRVLEARGLLCYWAVRELGVTMSSLARKLGISIPSVSESFTRGERIAQAEGCSLLEPSILRAPFDFRNCWSGTWFRWHFAKPLPHHSVRSRR